MKKLIDAIFEAWGYVPIWQLHETALRERREGYHAGVASGDVYQPIGWVKPGEPSIDVDEHTKTDAVFSQNVVVKGYTRRKRKGTAFNPLDHEQSK